MQEWDIYLVVVSLIGFIGAIYKLFFQPIQKLTMNIVELTNELKHINISNAKQDEILSKHGETLADHENRITIFEQIGFVKDRNN